MPITPYLKGKAFDPNLVRTMGTAFERVCDALDCEKGRPSGTTRRSRVGVWHRDRWKHSRALFDPVMRTSLRSAAEPSMAGHGHLPHTCLQASCLDLSPSAILFKFTCPSARKIGRASCRESGLL